MPRCPQGLTLILPQKAEWFVVSPMQTTAEFTTIHRLILESTELVQTSDRQHAPVQDDARPRKSQRVDAESDLHSRPAWTFP
jgi:hypothetical protein